MAEATSHEQGPSVPYQAISLLKGIKLYGDTVADSVRHIKQYSEKELEEKGITKSGKVQAEGIWNYVNHLSEDLIGKQNLDKKDPRWKASYQAISAVVKQFGSKGITTDLLEAVIGAYINTSVQYAAEKDQQLVASMPTNNGKEAVKKFAYLTGQDVVFSKYIEDAKDPVEVAGIKSQLEPRIRETVNTAIATGTLDELIKKAEAAQHN